MAIMYMSICPRCANFKVPRTCQFCNIQQIPVDVTLEESMEMSERQEEEVINQYIETLIKDTYDPKAREYREANQKSVFSGYVRDSGPKCPTCGSTKVEKISATKKVLGGAVFGLMSSDVRNTMHCRNCGAKW